MQANLPAALSGQSGRPGASGNPGDNGFFRVIGSKGFKPFLRVAADCVSFVLALRQKAHSLRRSSFPHKVVRLCRGSDIVGGDILSQLILISFPLQASKPIFQAGGHGDHLVNGGFQLCLIAGAVLRSLIFNVPLPLS